MIPAVHKAADTSWRAWAVVAFLVVVAAALRFYHLEGQLWLDEVSALRGYREPFLKTLTTFPIFFPNPLYELMAHAGILLFGENAWAIRFPAALFGVAGVIAFYILAQRCLGRSSGILAGFLFAVSFHHVFFSQDARGYTAYLFFAIYATDRLLALLDHMSWRTGAAYIALLALGTYAHPFGVFVLAGHMLVALVVAWTRGRRGVSGTPAVRQIVALAVLSGLAITTLYASLIPDAVRYALTEARTVGHGPRLTSLLPELLDGLKAGLGGWPGLIIGGLLGGVGTLDLFRRRPVAVALLGAPIVVSAVTVIVLGAGVHPRYFLLALPLGYLVATHAVMSIVGWLTQSARRLSPQRAVTLEVGVGLALVVISCVPLKRYYQVPKQDYRGAIRELRQLAGPGDRVVALAHAGFAMKNFYDPDFTVAADLDELQPIEAEGHRVWLMVTLEHELASSAPESFAHLRRNYQQVKLLPATIGDGGIRIYFREATR
jgi:4-amino-4-deoxy-L-arabinose transferase-like glycosyltransferase